MLKREDIRIRDPFILTDKEQGCYYMYGTTALVADSIAARGTFSVYRTVDLENFEEPKVIVDSDKLGFWGRFDFWAPEVHKYNGAYYMFTTYLNAKTNHRGCTIMKSDSPEGPFVEITGGHITPADWDAIDGTFYVDPDGQPWMVFVHEWTSMPRNVGSFAAAKLSDDLTHFVSEPFELFSANEPYWTRASGLHITDGCWLYTTQSGELLMTWSNFCEEGYAVAQVRSSNGRLDGEWSHVDMLYTRSMTEENRYDGGHAMTFTARDGQMYLSFHSPNGGIGNRYETPVFLAVREENDRLVWDEPRPTHN